ncbi:MAG: DUF2203 domain-containing protein [bacterium]|nr:DUF2203 domain-containing protein [bacterium]
MPAFQHENHYSIVEAGSLLPWLTEKLGGVQELFNRLEELGFDPVTCKWTPFGNGHSKGPPPKEYEILVKVIAEIDQKGVVIKNFLKGIVDFPHINSDGREVYLCWILGEEAVSHWHYLTDQFMDRVPIFPEPVDPPPALNR